MAKMIRHSLSGKLLLPVIIISVVATLFLSAFFHITSDKLSHEMIEKRAFELAEILVIKVETNSSQSHIKRVISTISAYDDVNSIFLVNRLSGRILTSSLNRYNNQSIKDIQNKKIIESIHNLNSKKSNKPLLLEADNNGYHSLILPFNAVSQDKRSIIPIILIVTINDQDIKSNLRDFLLPAMVIQALTLILIAAFFFIFARKIILEPIHKLIKAIDHSSNEEKSYVDMIESKDEMGLLIRRYNKMLKETHEYQNKLIYEKEKSDSAAKAKSNFLAVMTHELRTPLNGVIGMSELLSEAPLNDKYKGYLGTVNQSGKQLLAIINDILDFSKIESGKLDLNPVNFKLDELCQNIVNVMEFQAAEKQLTLSWANSIPDYKLNLYGDDIRLNQILINLISNGIKFTHSGHIALTCSEFTHTNDSELNLQIKVTDTGIGISKNQITNLFQHFSQAAASTTRQYGGTGLGLAICKQLCKKMGGDITVESRKGIGTTFIVKLTLPLSQEDQAIDTAEHNHKTWENSHFVKNDIQPHILVVDDTPINLELACAILEDENIKVSTRANGKEAFDAYQEHTYDLILMDCLMPIMDGFESSKSIREYEVKNNMTATAIIALTASALNETKDKCRNAGMDDFLTKPLDRDKLIETIQYYLLKTSVISEVHE